MFNNQMVIDFLRKRVWGGISSKKIDVLVDLGILQVKAYPNYPLKICVRHIFFGSQVESLLHIV